MRAFLFARATAAPPGWRRRRTRLNSSFPKREIACLSPARLGLTSEKIAKATGYRVNTVNSYLISAAKKLKAGNRTKAIADAIRRRLVACSAFKAIFRRNTKDLAK
ncbi:LuxR C-terminal-related transcriptional regulator [Rhizobium lusitanum]|uniref:LuxR C-terminal-related transcriptional regulator n=1 Tax=Rhizobium lusitanum TaxID=293958 RepID=UPI001FD28C6C